DSQRGPRPLASSPRLIVRFRNQGEGATCQRASSGRFQDRVLPTGSRILHRGRGALRKDLSEEIPYVVNVVLDVEIVQIQAVGLKEFIALEFQRCGDLTALLAIENLIADGDDQDLLEIVDADLRCVLDFIMHVPPRS